MTTQATQAAKSCTVGSHQWMTQRGEDGKRYEECRGCGRRANWVSLWATD
jgi:hypothetical protein